MSNFTDFTTLLQPDAWDAYDAVEVKLHATTLITLTLKAEPKYNASLPVSIKVDNVPLFYSVDPINANGILNTGRSLTYTFSVTWVPVSDFLPPPSELHPHFDVEVSFLGHTDSYPVFIVPSNR